MLDGGACAVGIESTIVDCTADVPRILRPGQLSAADIGAVLDLPPEVLLRAAPQGPRVAGALPSHYAPRTPLVLRTAAEIDAEWPTAAARVAVLALHAAPASAQRHWLTLARDPATYAQEMYAALRTLDAGGHDALWVEAVPDTAEWLAIRDRLTRAAHGSGADAQLR